MNVVCNNPILYVVDYPLLDAVEVIDKRSGRGGLIRAEAAQRFRTALQHVVASQDPDDFERFIDDYDALLMQRVVYH